MPYGVFFKWPWGEAGGNVFATVLREIARYGLYAFFTRRQADLLPSFKKYVADNSLGDEPLWIAIRRWWDTQFANEEDPTNPRGWSSAGYRCWRPDQKDAWAMFNGRPRPLLGVIGDDHQSYLDWWDVPEWMDSVTVDEAFAGKRLSG